MYVLNKFIPAVIIPQGILMDSTSDLVVFDKRNTHCYYWIKRNICLYPKGGDGAHQRLIKMKADL